MGIFAKDDGRRIPDQVWALMKPLVPPGKPHPNGGHNPGVPDRNAMNAILFVLRTGCQWNALNATAICSCSSAYRRFREWLEVGVFLTLNAHRASLQSSNGSKVLQPAGKLEDCSRQRFDCSPASVRAGLLSVGTLSHAFKSACSGPEFVPRKMWFRSHTASERSTALF